MKTAQLKTAFENFNQQQILIIGDVMIDSYMWGKVDRISPEAPVPIIAVKQRESRLGGAANVGLNVRALGAKPIMCALIGDDDFGAIFLSLLKKRQMSANGMLISDQRKTTVKTRIISDGQHLLRVDEEETEPLTAALEKQFIDHIHTLFEKYSFDAIIFEDYDKGNITPRIIDAVVHLARQKKIPTLVDPKKRNYNHYKGVGLFKPNFKEICEGSKIDIPKGDFNALHQACRNLLNKLHAQSIMVTLSELGVFITDNGHYHRLPAEVRDIADVSGAGDTVIGVAACAMAAGLQAKDLAVIANLAGGLVCEKVGVVPVDKTELFNETLQYFSHETK